MCHSSHICNPRSLERDLERSRADHISEMENLIEKHRQQVSETKKKQWVSFSIGTELVKFSVLVFVRLFSFDEYFIKSDYNISKHRRYY